MRLRTNAKLYDFMHAQKQKIDASARFMRVVHETQEQRIERAMAEVEKHYCRGL